MGWGKLLYKIVGTSEKLTKRKKNKKQDTRTSFKKMVKMREQMKHYLTNDDLKDEEKKRLISTKKKEIEQRMDAFHEVGLCALFVFPPR